MSETKHSPEPWILGDYGGVCRKPSHAKGHPGPGGKDGCVYEPTLYTGDEWDRCVSSEPSKETLVGWDEDAPMLNRENARRIVACVNACAGIPTEALEAGALAEVVAFVRALDESGAYDVPPEAWAGRVAACVHACAGVPTESLKRPMTPGECYCQPGDPPAVCPLHRPPAPKEGGR